MAPFWRISCPRQILESRDISLSTFQVFLFAYFIRRISFYCTRRTALEATGGGLVNAAQGGGKLNYTLFIAAARCACARPYDLTRAAAYQTAVYEIVAGDIHRYEIRGV